MARRRPGACRVERRHCFSPNAEAVAEDWKKAREGFGFLKEREGWTEKQAKQIPVSGKAQPYSLKYTEGVWEPQDAKDYDDKADLAFLGNDRLQPKDADKR